MIDDAPALAPIPRELLFGDPLRINPQLSPDGTRMAYVALYVIDSRKSNTGRLVKLDVHSGVFEVIAEDPDYDVGDAIVHPDTREIQMVAFRRVRTDWLILDAAIEGDVAAIRQLHHGDFFLVSRDHADRAWLVAFTAADGPIAYVGTRASR